MEAAIQTARGLIEGLTNYKFTAAMGRWWTAEWGGVGMFDWPVSLPFF